MMRALLVKIHRWVGLTMAVFLVLVGLTGSVIAFYSELELRVNPELYPERPTQHQLSLAKLAQLTEAQEPQVRVNGVNMGERAWRWVSVAPKTDPATMKPYQLDFDEIFVDPYTGKELGKRTWGDISQGRINLLPFIFTLHYSLALSHIGELLLGIVALAWTLDCFIGFYLTLPHRSAKSPASPVGQSKGWWARWKPAWQVRWRARAFKLNFDLHRAGGLWLWGILLVFAWSSVYMNLHDAVYAPSVRVLMTYKTPETELARVAGFDVPRLGWSAAEARAQQLTSELARTYHFRPLQTISLSLDRDHGVYVYGIRSDRDISDHDRYAQTQIHFDANDGTLKSVLLPTGQYAGNTITSWLNNLHMANVFGLPYQIFVSLLGAVVVILSLTGTYIWLRKRSARHSTLAKQQPRDNLPHFTQPSAIDGSR